MPHAGALSYGYSITPIRSCQGGKKGAALYQRPPVRDWSLIVLVFALDRLVRRSARDDVFLAKPEHGLLILFFREHEIGFADVSGFYDV
jgi:hypothetical protein